MKKTIDTNELKSIQLKLLDALKDYCNKNDLTYYLAYGTLIGAVRHKGYIPWDDDIDVMMPRADYEKFVMGFNVDTENINIGVVSRDVDPEYYLPFAKLINSDTIMQEEVNSNYQIGVYIDIFPLDNLADNYEKAKKLIRKAFRYNEILLLKNLVINKDRAWHKNAVIKAGRIVSKLWSRDFLIKRLNDLGVRNNDVFFTEYVGMMTGIYTGDESGVFKSEWFKDVITVEFEGKEYNAPSGYDALLRRLYGDYMKLPPVEEQVSHHSFMAWYKIV